MIVGVSALALVFLVSGCGDSPDSVMKDQIKASNEVLDVLEGIKTKEDAEKAKAKLEDLDKKFKDVIEREKKIKVSKDQEKKLQEKYKDDLERVEKRMMAAALKLAGNPDSVQILKPALEKIKKTVEEAQKSILAGK